jgi:hypothetical protein
MNANPKSLPREERNISSAPRRFQRVFLAASGALLLSACVVYDGPPRRVVYVRQPPIVVEQQPAYPVGTEVVADSAPPVPLAEVETASPGVDFVWIPGIWVWEGRWIWTAGHWDRPPFPGAVWVPHRYVYRNGAHVFIRGGWR